LEGTLPFRIVKMRRVRGCGRRVAFAVIETPYGNVWLDYVAAAAGSDAFVAPASIGGRRTWTIGRGFAAAVQPIFERFLDDAE
jgi:hypothetical protein